MNKLTFLILLTLLLIFCTGYLAYRSENKDMLMDFSSYLATQLEGHLLEGQNWRSFIYAFGFGFIDNFILYYAIQAFNVLVAGNPSFVAGIGNAYALGTGTIIGTFFSKVMGRVMGEPGPTPLWIDVSGIVLGGLSGLLVANFF